MKGIPSLEWISLTPSGLTEMEDIALAANLAVSSLTFLPTAWIRAERRRGDKMIACRVDSFFARLSIT